MKYFLYVYHFLHDFGLAKVSRDPVQHQSVDVRLELVRFHGRIDCLSPKFHRNIIRYELTFTGIIKECLPDFRARVDGAEYVATSAVIQAGDRAECFPLRAFAAARRAKKDKGVVSHHERNPLILQAGWDGEAESERLLPGQQRIDIYPPPAAIESHAAVQQRKNFVPRWRTMMLPATTISLPNFFTPSRLLTLSRPILTLPCHFL